MFVYHNFLCHFIQVYRSTTSWHNVQVSLPSIQSQGFLYLIQATNTGNSPLYLQKDFVLISITSVLFQIQICFNKYQHKEYCMISKVEDTIDQIVFKLAKIEKESKQLVTGRDIFMFIGSTGVGKSTLINLLLNRKLYCKNKGLILPDSKVQFQGPRITQNPSIQQTMDISVWNNQSSLLMCDTPGFGYTLGYLVDIYNCSYIAGVVKHAKNLKVILVLSESELTEPKYTKLRKLIKKISQAFTTFNTNNLQVCITRTYRFDDQDEIHNEFRAILDKGQNHTQKQAQMLKFLASSCKIHLFPFARKVGEQISIEPGTKNQILKMDNSIKNSYAGQHFNFISQESKISILQLIQTLNDQKLKFNKDKQIAYSSLKDVEKVLNELYHGIISPQEALQKIKVEGTENGVKIAVGGIAYIIGVQVARYAVTYALLAIGEAAIGAAALGGAGYVLSILGGPIGLGVAVGLTAIGFLAKLIYSKYENKKKATEHLENVIKTIKNVIEADQLFIKKIDQIQVNLNMCIK